MRVAIVHDWLYVLGGAEKVLSAILRHFPDADVFCLFDVLSPNDRKQVGYHKSQVSFLQRMPGIGRYHRMYLPIMPLAIEQFDMAGYDLIISSSYAVAKGVLTGPDQLHLAYVHSPMRYAWDLQHQYLRNAGLERGIKSWLTRLLLHRIRIWDVRTANGPDAYLANSQFIARRIRKIYGRDAKVVYPPVHVPEILEPSNKELHFLTASRLVSYKNIMPIVEAFKNFPKERLIVAGDGPDAGRLKAIAGANVEFRGFVPDIELRRLMRTARAFIFAAEDDFGIVPVEAQSEGTPVLALGRGGARETIIGGGRAPTGVFFDKADPAAISGAIQHFVENEHLFISTNCHSNALRFSETQFHKVFGDFVADQVDTFFQRVGDPQTGMIAPLVQKERRPVSVGTSSKVADVV